ncbi:hypothetical protein [Arthrobacter sp. SD76]|uniref:hypothetical protein n=1 Tax=Arthrobacter sp. SD76 TaxID=3415007 RepID=UPI003C751E74
MCEAAGISRRTFFNYFPTKEDAIIGHAEDDIPGTSSKNSSPAARIPQPGKSPPPCSAIWSGFRCASQKVCQLPKRKPGS